MRCHGQYQYLACHWQTSKLELDIIISVAVMHGCISVRRLKVSLVLDILLLLHNFQAEKLCNRILVTSSSYASFPIIIMSFFVGSMFLMRRLHLTRSCATSRDNSFSDKSFLMLFIQPPLLRSFSPSFLRHPHPHHNTRGKTDLHIHRTTHTFAKQCLRQNIPVLLNNAPSSITDKFLTHSIQGCSNYVKNHFVNKYQQHCTIPNCYICQL